MSSNKNAPQIEITLPRAELAAAVDWPARLVRGVPAHPVMGGVLIETAAGDRKGDSGELALTTFDFQVSARAITAANVTAGGRALVSARLLAAIEKVLPGTTVTITTHDTFVRIAAGSAEFDLPSMPVEDYPRVPSMPLPIGQVDGTVWAEAVQRVAPVADMSATDALAGVLITIEGGELRLTATNRYQFADALAPWQPAQASGHVVRTLLVPADVLLEASKATAQVGGTVTLATSDQATGVFGLSCDGRRMTAPVIDLPFPDLQKAIPAKHTYRAEVSVDELAAAVARVSVAATSKDDDTLSLEFTPDRVQLTAGTQDQAGVARDSVPLTFEGGREFTIGFSAARLRSGLSTMHSDLAEMLFTNVNGVALLRPLVNGHPSPSFTYGVMPMRVPGRDTASAA
jgi:DNA polymerase-3 subunit beta